MQSSTASFEELQTAIAPLMGMDHGGIYRPKLVMFGDLLAEPDWTHAREAIGKCDVLLSVGTSGIVYPAATLPDLRGDTVRRRRD